MPKTPKKTNKLRVLKISTIAISSVVLIEVVLGLTTRSLAILSDGLHALLDALTTFGLLFATRAALKPPDEEHTYGHEKFESLGGLAGGMVLIGVALLIMYEAVQRAIVNQPYLNQEFEFAGFLAIGYTFCIDFLRVKIFSKTVHEESTTVKVGFYHAIADLSSTIIALLGFGLATQGIYRGDAAASMILSVLLIYLSAKAIWSSGMELSDAISKDIVEKVRQEILGVSGVCGCEGLRVRKAGAKTFVEATVKVSELMSLEEAHTLASRIENSIKAVFGEAETTIHVEPLSEGSKIESLVEKLASEVEGVKETHRIRVVHIGGKLYVTLHARVDPQLSVQEAHEIAEKIEDKINGRMSKIENVTVHVEPFNARTTKSTEVNEGEVRKIIYKTMEKFSQALECKRIVTYIADRRCYISIDCGFSRQIPIKEAHKIASEIERNVKRRFAEAIVTVHTEPS
ncbi:MAG: cation diffusion facilitator family transporter [Candidatus Bathyarchaeia archaeon]